MVILGYRSAAAVRRSRLATAAFWLALLTLPVFSLPAMAGTARGLGEAGISLMFCVVLGGPVVALLMSIAARLRLNASLRGRSSTVAGIVLSSISCAMLAGLFYILSQWGCCC